MIKVETIDLDNNWEWVDKYDDLQQVVETLNDSIQGTNFYTRVEWNAKRGEGQYWTLEQDTKEVVGFGIIYEVRNRPRVTIDDVLKLIEK